MSLADLTGGRGDLPELITEALMSVLKANVGISRLDCRRGWSSNHSSSRHGRDWTSLVAEALPEGGLAVGPPLEETRLSLNHASPRGRHRAKQCDTQRSGAGVGSDTGAHVICWQAVTSAGSSQPKYTDPIDVLSIWARRLSAPGG